MASVLELILRSRKEGEAAKKTTADLKGVTKAAEGTAKATKKLNIAMLAVKGAVMTAGITFLKSVPAILDQGLAIERAEVALIAYSGSAEEATRTIELMKESTGGAMSRMAAMQNATRMLSMGLASNADEAANLTKIAITLGSTMGKGPQAAIEDFTLMLANQSILRLDTFGISGANVRARMQELAQQGFAPADRQLRFLTATMEMAEGKMKALDEAGFEATSNVDRLRATIEDLKAETITWLSDGLMPWIDGLYALRDAQIEHEEEIMHSTGSYQDYVDEMLRSGIATTKWGVTVGLATEAEWNATNATDGMIAAMERYAVIADTATTNAGGLAEANTAIALSLGDITQATLAKEALEGLNEAWGEGLLSEEDYKSMYTDVALNIAGLDQPAVDAKLALFDMQQQLGETGEIGTYIGMVGDLGREIGALPDYKKIKIDLLITRLEEEEGLYQRGGSFIVRGPPGPDRVPVRFRATAGEKVTITPAAQITNNNQQTNIGPFTNNFSNETDEFAFLDKFKRAIARV